jgi:hypothetical protein
MIKKSKAFTERLDTLLTLFYYGEPMNGGEYPKEQFDRMKQDTVIRAAHSEILALVADEIDDALANQATPTVSGKQVAKLVEYIDERIAYGKKYRSKYPEDFRSGFSGIESGECCDKCAMTSPKDPLQALVGCKNPFQLPEACSCHIANRRLAEQSIVAELTNMRWRLTGVTDLKPSDPEAKSGSSKSQSKATLKKGSE